MTERVLAFEDLALLPQPRSIRPISGTAVQLAHLTGIIVPEHLTGIADGVAERFERAVGRRLDVRSRDSGQANVIVLSEAGRGAQTHERADAFRRADETSEESGESYELTVDRRIVLTSSCRAGMRHALVTLDQMIAAVAEHGDAGSLPSVPAMHLVDAPQHPWRGFSIDVARSFIPVAEMLRLVDLLAAYKLNVLHVHLSDDQAWRLHIDSWPELSERARHAAIDGGRSGCYSKEDYQQIVEHASERGVLVVPEIDVPGHTHAVHVAYPELTRDGLPVEPYTGDHVGFSAITMALARTEDFLRDVITEVAALTPGPYIHIGGDEALAMTADEYADVVVAAQQAVLQNGKRPIGWNEVAAAALDPATIVQYWDVNADIGPVVAAAERGHDIILSPANRVYLDMKPNAEFPIGQDWAGLVDVETAYRWQPEDVVPGIPPERILGIEAALWTETVRDADDVRSLLLPRLPAVAEVAWSGPVRDVDDIHQVLAVHAGRWANVLRLAPPR